MNKFEKKFGKYAIHNISLVLICCYIIGYVLSVLNSSFLGYLTLDPYKILHGQIWRLVTWVVQPPSSLSLFTIFMLLFYYNIGTSLEHVWGTYRYNVYLLSGMLFTIAGSFIALGITYLLYGGDSLAAMSLMGSQQFSTYYVNMSIFMAAAVTFPDSQVLLMFVIPVKFKWMGIIYGVILLLNLITGTGTAGTVFAFYDIFYRIAIVASLLNFLIFWLRSRRKKIIPKQMKKRQQFKQETRKSSKITRHKCAVCGQTDENDQTLEFRFCSKCNGNYEYCQHHLFTHEHVK